MRKTYPKDVRFLLADAVRQELGGKVSLLGMFPGYDVVLQSDLPAELPKGTNAFALSSLALLFVIHDGSGMFTLRVSVRDPSGKPIGGEGSPIQAEKRSGSAYALSVPMAPFPISEFGTYTATLQLDNRPYEFPFTIRHRDPAVKIPMAPAKAASDVDQTKNTHRRKQPVPAKGSETDDKRERVRARRASR